MKKLILCMLLVVIISAFIAAPVITMNVPARAFEVPASCALALYNPGLLINCLMMLAFELWNPLDWD